MDKILTFDPDTHTYFIDGKPLISVTQLLKKHGLAPDYSAVDEKTLSEDAERGQLIHKEIEDYVTQDIVGFSAELAEFIDWFKGVEYRLVVSETPVHNDIVAGTIDLLIEDKDGFYTFADIKTTSVLHIEAVSWQLSLYAYLARGGKPLDDAIGKALHFKKDGALRVVDIPLQPFEEVERLLDCERNGEIYTRNIEGIVSEAQVVQMREFERIIAEADAAKKEAEQSFKSMKAAIMDEMVKRGIKSFETDGIRLTYMLPQERNTIDADRLKKEQPEIAKQYSKTTTTAASLRITFKEGK